MKRSEREKIVYSAIKKYYNMHGYMPAYRDLTRLTGFTSTHIIHEALQDLLSSGKIETDEDKIKPRAYRIGRNESTKSKN